MSTDREEIRWKLQILSDLVSSTIETHEGERKKLEETWEKLERGLSEARNIWLGGIGFAIGIWISLISIGSVPKEQAWYIIIGMVLGFVIFVGINLYVGKMGRKFYVLDNKYEQDKLDLLKFEGWLLGRSMREDVTLEQIAILLIFMGVITQILSYDLKYLAHKTFKSEKPKKEDFQVTYELAKNNLAHIQSLGLKEECNRIESFIKEFEKYKKSK